MLQLKLYILDLILRTGNDRTNNGPTKIKNGQEV